MRIVPCAPVTGLIRERSPPTAYRGWPGGQSAASGRLREGGRRREPGVRVCSDKPAEQRLHYEATYATDPRLQRRRRRQRSHRVPEERPSRGEGQGQEGVWRRLRVQGHQIRRSPRGTLQIPGKQFSEVVIIIHSDLACRYYSSAMPMHFPSLTINKI